MAPAARAVDAALESIPLAAFRFPVVANASAEANASPERVRELLVRQIDSPVRWEESVSLMAEAGVTHALEIGAGKVLSGLVKRIDKRIRVHSVSDPDSLQQIAAFLG